MKVALLQRELAWEDPVANREQFAAEISGLDADTDLVILPEMFTTGFSMAAERLAEPNAEVTLPWLQELARAQDVAITGSLAVRDGDKIANRLLFVTQNAHYHYDKRHLFRMSGEDQHYAAGTDKLIVEWRGWRICPMICYDLRFPVWSRNTGAGNPDIGSPHAGSPYAYDLLIFVANWPAKRRVHWRQLLIARAIENQSYCIGLNRVGSDNNGVDYCGDSLVLAADGKMVLDCGDSSGVFSAELERQSMDTYRAKFPCHKDADEFQLID